MAVAKQPSLVQAAGHCWGGHSSLLSHQQMAKDPLKRFWGWNEAGGVPGCVEWDRGRQNEMVTGQGGGRIRSRQGADLTVAVYAKPLISLPLSWAWSTFTNQLGLMTTGASPSWPAEAYPRGREQMVPPGGLWRLKLPCRMQQRPRQCHFIPLHGVAVDWGVHGTYCKSE